MIGGVSGGRMGGAGSSSESTSADNLTELPTQQRFVELEAKLKLNGAQQPLWNNYQDKVSALHADLMRTPSAAVVAKDSAIRQIDRKADLLRNRLAALEDIADAARLLYLSLTPEQKKIADSLLADTVPSLYDRFSQPQGRNGKPGGNGHEGGEGPPPRPN